MSKSKQQIPLKQVNSYLIFYAVDNYLQVSTTPGRNRFDIRLNALHNLAVLSKAIFRYGDFPDPGAKDICALQFLKVFSQITYLRTKYDPRTEENDVRSMDLARSHNSKMDKIYVELIDIIIHLKLIQPQSVEQLWGLNSSDLLEGQ